jgi:polar amino acid transport system substrate-binding protein
MAGPVNFAIQDMWNDGTYMKIYNKWYGADTPTIPDD